MKSNHLYGSFKGAINLLMPFFSFKIKNLLWAVFSHIWQEIINY